MKLLEDERRQVYEFLWAGDLLGIDGVDLHDFNAEAVTHVTLRRYPRRMVEALAQSHIARAYRLRLAVARVRRANQQMTLLGRRPAMERIASFLLVHSHSMVTDRRIVDVPMSRADIADNLGLTIETVCRALARLRRDGIVAIRRGGFELRDRGALLELARGTNAAYGLTS